MLTALGLLGFTEQMGVLPIAISTSFIIDVSDLFSNPSKEITHMMKKGYIIRMVIALFLLGTAVMLAYDGVHRVLFLEVLAGVLAFGAGTMLITYCEMKRMEGLA